MYSLYILLLGIAVGLYSFVPPLVLCGEAEDNCDVYVPDDFENVTVALHNFY